MRQLRTVLPGLMLLCLAFVCCPPVSGQVADTAASRQASENERRPFTENAQRYSIPVYPQYWVGGGLILLSPSFSGISSRYLPGDAPKAENVSPSFNCMTRIQFSRYFSTNFSLAFGGKRKTSYSRMGVTVCFHIPLMQYQTSGFHIGAGLARIAFAHDGSISPDYGMRINSERNAFHILIGADLLMAGGPGLSLSAGYDSQSEENGMDLSSPFFTASILF